MAKIYFDLGVGLHAIRRVNEAMQAMQVAAELGKSNAADAFYQAGVWAFEQMVFRHAEDMFRRTIDVVPGHASAYSNLGVALQYQTRFTEALKAYGTSLHLNPHDARNYFNKGKVLQELGRPKPAIRAFRKAVQLDPLYFEAYATWGGELKCVCLDLSQPILI